MKKSGFDSRLWIAAATGGMVLVAVALALFLVSPVQSGYHVITDAELSSIELLGKYVYFDKISDPSRMSCATCHEPKTGGTGAKLEVNLHQVAFTGANPHTVGNLKPPTNTYASFIEPLHPCSTGGLGRRNVCGGNFWDGRAEGNEVPLFPFGATRHIGNEIFYTSQGVDLATVYPGVWDYAGYIGPVADQALNPMPNPVEQNISRQNVCLAVKNAKYAPLYKKVWGVNMDCGDTPVAVSAPDVTDAPEKAFDITYKRLMLSVAAWQASKDLNSFSSKHDFALRAELACACQNPAGAEYPGDEVCAVVGSDASPAVCADADYLDSMGTFPLVGLTAQENWGHDLYFGFTSELNPTGKNGRCGDCHINNPPRRGPGGIFIPGDTGEELFQDFSADDYHNIGTPRNPEIPVTYKSDGTPIDPDLGFAGHAGPAIPPYNPGFFKTPTIRNVDKRHETDFIKAYTHNGWFKSLESLVHFYNTAFLGDSRTPYEETTAYTFGITRCPPEITTEAEALANNCWPEPAYPSNAMPFLVGNLKLTAEEEAAIVAYMKTLTDMHTAKPPRPYRSK